MADKEKKSTALAKPDNETVYDEWYVNLTVEEVKAARKIYVDAINFLINDLLPKMTYYYVVVTVMGVVGSGAILWVLLREKELRKSFFYRILMLNTVCETAACVSSLQKQAYNVFLIYSKTFRITKAGWALATKSFTLWAVDMTGFLNLSLSDMGSWLTIVMTLDRVYSLFWPVHYKAIFLPRQKKALFIVILLFLLVWPCYWANNLCRYPHLGMDPRDNSTEYRVANLKTAARMHPAMKPFIDQALTITRTATYFRCLASISILFPGSVAIAVKLFSTKPPENMVGATEAHNARRQGALMVLISGVLVLIYNVAFAVATYLRYLDLYHYDFVRANRYHKKWPEVTLEMLVAASNNYANLSYAVPFSNAMFITYALNFYLMVVFVRSFRKAAIKSFGLTKFAEISATKTATAGAVAREIPLMETNRN